MSDIGFTPHQLKQFSTIVDRQLEIGLKKGLQKGLQEGLGPIIDKLLEHDRRFAKIDEVLDRLKLMPTLSELQILQEKLISRILPCEEEHTVMHGRILRCEKQLGLT